MHYYVQLMLLTFRRNWVFSGLVVLIISMGIAASTSMLAVLRTLGADPVPGVSARLIHPQIEPAVAGHPSSHGALPDSLMWPDAQGLLRASGAVRKAIVLGAQLTLVPPQGSAHARFIKATLTQAAFLDMVRASFVEGGAWAPADDERASRIIVISDRLARANFGTVHALGRTVRLGTVDFRVVGVLDQWDPRPRFYDLDGGAFAAPEDVFMPLATARALHIEPSTSPECWGSEFPDMNQLDNAPCTWAPMWVELASHADINAYLNTMRGYAAEQRTLGRFIHEPRIDAPTAMQWIQRKGVIPPAARLQAFIGYGFLLICVGNAAGLLLIMFLGRRREMGLRRALGATRGQVFAHLVAETAGIAVVSCAGGIGLTELAMRVLRTRPEAYYSAIGFDPLVLIVGVGLTLLASALATCVPAWHVARRHPYSMLRS